MLILGIGGLGYRNSSAALVRDGRVVAAAAEERFTGQKNEGGFPSRAIDACLRMAGASLADVDHVAVANNPWLGLRDKVLSWYGEQFFDSPEFRAYHIFHDQSHGTLVYLKALEELRGVREDRFHVVPHHLSHMASSFYACAHDEAAILDMDGRGELSTSAQGVGRGAAIEVFRVDQMPNSLGLLYASVTDYLGFSGADDEFRVMSLSTQGEAEYLDAFRRVVRLEGDGAFRLDDSYFIYRDGLAALSRRFTDEFGPRRDPGDPVERRHVDIAASLQAITEEAVLHAARHLHSVTGLSTLCYSGGVALNWAVNGRLAQDGPFEEVYVNPLAGDEGTAVGAALSVYAKETGTRPEPLGSVALGPEVTDSEVEAALQRTGLRYERVSDRVHVAAERLARGQIVGWFQGRMEFGPRALGQRAILADPGNLQTKARILRDVKSREEHHPFAVSLQQEAAERVFGAGASSPYLLRWHPVAEAYRGELQGVVTPDGRARWHGAAADREPQFHALLGAYGRLTGRLPALLNTSLNVPGRPPATTAREAIELFAGSGLDALMIGPFLLTK